jgi:acetyl-CoA acetyltransferase
MVVTGVDPTIMLTGVIPVTELALKKAGMTMNDIDLFEVNEAFASVPLAWAKDMNADMDKVNVNGGAIALGHPLGCSGARLLITLLHEMERRDVQTGLATLCIGFGMAVATIIERA